MQDQGSIIGEISHTKRNEGGGGIEGRPTLLTTLISPPVQHHLSVHAFDVQLPPCIVLSEV